MKTRKYYYHGTDSVSACLIMRSGFKVKEFSRHGEVLGQGLYVAQYPASAAHWGNYLVTCELVRGAKIVWMEKDYDKSIISHLRREFGSELLEFGNNFEKAIPSNKKLTKMELISLLSYYWDIRHRKPLNWKSKGGRQTWYYKNMARLDKLIRQAGFDALGDRTSKCWDSDEIMFFNPSMIKPVSVQHMENHQEFLNKNNYSAEFYRNFDLKLSDTIPIEEIFNIACNEVLNYFKKIRVSYRDGALTGISNADGNEIYSSARLVLLKIILGIYGPREDGDFQVSYRCNRLYVDKLNDG